MKSTVVALIMVGAFAVTTTEAFAWASNHHSGGAHHEVWYGNGPAASVPEPSAMYALTSGLALLGGAGWYLRRRK
jgi:LPXTG-motif cell wall-anchored protein